VCGHSVRSCILCLCVHLKREEEEEKGGRGREGGKDEEMEGRREMEGGREEGVKGGREGRMKRWREGGKWREVGRKG